MTIESNIKKEIYGNTINLVHLNMKYLDDMWEYSSDSRLYEHFEFGAQEKYSDTKKYLEKLIQRSNKPDAHWWFIEINKTKKVVGTIGVHDINEPRRACEISYAVSPLFWGQGVFVSALNMTLRHLIHHNDFHRVTAITSSENIRSIKALKKFGFIEEGVMRDYYCKNGDYFCATFLALLDSEFKELILDK